MKKPSILLLETFDNYSVDIFAKEDSFMNDFSDKALRELNNQGYIDVIEKGKYCRHNFRDENVIASFIVKNGGVAYWSAMHYHGLTEQIPNVMYVQTTMIKANKTIFGIRYKFIKVKNEKLIGFKKLGYGNHQFRITDVEKTIVDCFDLPQYGGGYAEIIKAFNNAKLSAQKMVKYCKAINNIAVTKRLAFLTELLKKPDMDYFKKYAQSVKNKKYNLFESGGFQTGKTNSRWNLIINIDEDEIIEIANS
ncbi:MAG: hypothetical protein HN704_16925 [Bacteroidetes bacterium]|jgi:predicted transcriptional regulator of viral defense system|nr:hypothetical protein [Bacteroidota bacterium]MBT6687728.1 hypothetical protein [Bacteroidota bacterium]MBT7143678.1 hypothetical protein [Bacteroidota bacterium]MBT7493284.1 hypothetical protein [Bacteroidota bacterium]